MLVHLFDRRIRPSGTVSRFRGKDNGTSRFMIIQVSMNSDLFFPKGIGIFARGIFFLSVTFTTDQTFLKVDWLTVVGVGSPFSLLRYFKKMVFVTPILEPQEAAMGFCMR
jgi:hypothetical protein